MVLSYSWNPPPPILFKGGGQDLPKIESLGGGGTKHFARKGDKPEKGGGGCHFFITLQFNCIYCVWGEKVKFGLLHFDSSVF